MRKLTIISVIAFLFMLFFYSSVASVNGRMCWAETAEEGEVINNFCPVMGGKVDKDTPYRIAYKDKIIGFCCPGCIAEFKKDPQKYVKKIKDQEAINIAAEEHLSGALEDDVRIVEVKASRYSFNPDPIVVRLGEKVRLRLTSNDVTHGLSIKDFGVNVTAPVGKTETVEFTAEKTGDFQIDCSVYCGPGHGKMRGTLKVIR